MRYSEPRIQLQQLLTKREMTIFCRFMIGPREAPTPKQKIELDKVMVKVRRENRRVKQAERRFIKKARELLKKYDHKYKTDGAE